MSDPTGPWLSVRGDARQTVAPDYVVLDATIASFRGSKGAALRAAASSLDRLTADLASLGAVPLGAETERSPMTWSAQSATTQVERDHNKKTGRYEPTGQVTATVAILITVRALDKLDALGAALATHENLHVHAVSWEVDWDNPAWPQVRAAAIRAAVRKGRDYAAALGGSLHRVEHIADVGLLGGGEPAHFRAASARSPLLAGRGGEESDAPSLDPVPQELTAVIEARFVATGVSLPDR